MITLTIEDNTLLLFKPWLLGYCNCGCDEQLGYRLNEQNKFKHGHHARGRTGFNHSNWKGGRRKNHGYWELWMPGHYRTRKQGRVLEHIYFYESYHKVCVLPWVDVHHIDGNKEMNMPWNLILINHGDHTRHHIKDIVHPKKDMSDRRCKKCGLTKTWINKRNNRSSWYGNKDVGFVCVKCYAKSKATQLRAIGK